jgi:RNase P subunit RPR2
MTYWNNPESWTLDYQRRICPKCKTPFPAIRIPKSFREAMWGGWTCAHCGLSVNKLGRPH